MNVELVQAWVTRNEPQGEAKLAVAARVSVQTVQNLLRGASLRLDCAKRVAAALDVTLDELCRESKDSA